MCTKFNTGKMKIFVVILCIAYAWVVNAQPTIERQVFGTQGASSNNGQIIIDWTLGESAVSTVITSFGSFKEGFQQGFKKADIPSAIDYKDFDISIFPNPTSSVVTVKLHQNPNEVIIWSLYNLNGTLLKSNNFLFSEHPEIDISSYPDGLYVLKLSSDQSNQAHRIIKTTLF